MTTTQDILTAIHQERIQQEKLCREGRFRSTLANVEMSDSDKLAVVVEEVGEVSRAVLEKIRQVHDITDADLRKELIQVAACCVAWVEALDKTDSDAQLRLHY